MSRNARRALQRTVVSSVGTCIRLPPVRLLSSSPAIIDDAPPSLPPTTPRKFLLPHAKPFRSFLTDGHDRFHNYLRISITERCNLRCTYCMPSEGIDLTPTDKLLTSTEIIRLASLFVEHGVTKIRLTGGEPTVRKDCVELVEELGKLRPIGLKEIAMTSNGIALWRKLERMVAGGLTHLNLSLDTLDPFKYQIITRRMGFETVLKTIDRALELGIAPLKLNCVVIKNLNDAEVLDFVDLTREKPIEVRFIEFMPFDGNKWDFAKIVSAKTLLERIRDVHPNIEPLPALPGETSKTYHLPGTHLGRVGFISSMTDHFCGTCNRLRITADGNLKVCLFGEDEVSLRDLMRGGASDEDLLQVIGKAVGDKKEAHGGMKVEELKYGNNRSMIRIGG